MRNHLRVLLIIAAALLLVLSTAAVAKEEAPKPEKMKKLSFPKFKEFTTDNKIEVVVIEHHEQPIVTLAAVIKAGGVLDPWEKIGLSGFVAELLNKGTTSKSANELAEWIESAGGQVGVFSVDDYLYVTVSILTEYLDTAYEYLSDIIMNPIFPEDELEIYRKRIKTALEIELSQPAAVADRQFAQVIYGDHPYAKAPTPETVDAVTQADLAAFHKKNFVANNALIAVVGDVKHKKVKKAIKKYFGPWEQGEPEAATYTPAPERNSAQVYLYHKAGAVQTNYRVGHLGLPPIHPDWPAITVGNRILGGGSDARLFMNLREERGWTYGAYSSFGREPDVGTFRTWAAVKGEATDSALVELMKELEDIVTNPPSEEELNNAKSYLIGNFPNTIETPGQIAGQVIEVKQLGLGKKHLETYRDRLADVSAEDVNRVMNAHLHPDKAAIVLVGDALALLDKVEQFGEVAMFDLEGKPLSLAELDVKPADYEYDTSLLKDMTATYALNVQTMSLGDLNVAVKKMTVEGKDVFEMSSSIAGMITLNQTMVVSATDLSPVSYKSSFMAGPTQMMSELTFDNGGGSGTVKGPQDTEAKEVTVKLIQGAILDDAVEYAVSLLPMEVAQTFRFPVVDTKSGSLQNIDVEVLEEAAVEVPAGSFDTYKLKVKSPDAEYYYYCTKDLPHMLVKQEVPAQGLSLELKSHSK
jgi:predicted Zn-dependent peptidase